MSALESRVLIKLGGAVLTDSEVLTSICEDLAHLQAAGVSITLVHGGGAQINRELTFHGIQWNFHEGQRVTTPEMMEQIEKVLCGQVNKLIVRMLTRCGVRAAGFSGLDCGTLRCKQMNPFLGQVGEIEEVDLTLLRSFFSPTEKGEAIMPVIAPVGIGPRGQSFNVNADWAAVRIAEAIEAEKILFITDQPGILNQSGATLADLDAVQLQELMKDRTVQGGMLTKAKAVLHGLKNGISEIHILNGRQPKCISSLLLSGERNGTSCVPALNPDHQIRQIQPESHSYVQN